MNPNLHCLLLQVQDADARHFPIHPSHVRSSHGIGRPSEGLPDLVLNLAMKINETTDNASLKGYRPLKHTIMKEHQNNGPEIFLGWAPGQRCKKTSRTIILTHSMHATSSVPNSCWMLTPSRCQVTRKSIQETASLINVHP